MAYKLKTAGIAANCTMCIAVDPDTGTIKDFASAAVTADIQVGANVTIATQMWDGNARHYWRPGAGTTDADFVKFGTNKPRWDFNAADQERTAVFIGEAAGPYVRLFGSASNNYFAGQDGGGGGSTFPYVNGCGWVTAVNGGRPAAAAGEKWIFGFSAKHGAGSGFTTAYVAKDDAATVTAVSALAAPAFTSTSANFDITYMNRRTDSSAHQQDKTHAVLIFNTALTESQWDSLRGDWLGTLLEVDAGGSPPAGTVTIGTITPTSDGASVAFTYSAADQTGFEYRIDGGAPASAGTASPLVLTGMSPGTSDVEIRATNASGAGAWSTAAPFTVPAAATPVAFASGNPIPNFTPTVGVAFTFDFADRFTGDATPFTYALQAGALPAGLSLAGTVISGTPTTIETQTGIVIRATDQDSATADSNAFSMTVSAPAAGGSTVIVNLIGF